MSKTICDEKASHSGHIRRYGGCMYFGRGNRWLIATCSLLFTLFLVSCKTGPDYQRPTLNAPANYKSATAKETAQPELGQNWWQLFQDPELDALVEEALRENQDLKAAMARVAQSRASARSLKSSFYTVISTSPSVMRSRTPGSSNGDSSSDLSEVASTISQISGIISEINNLTQGTGTTPGAGTGLQTGAVSSDFSVSSTTSTRYQIPFDISYEIDIWGRLRRQYESAQAQAQASVCDLEVVRQTLLADLARNYFNLRSLDAQEEVLERSLALYQEQADLTRQQYKAGLTDEVNALQADIQLESTRAQATDTHRQRTDLEHAIAILLGRAPSQFSLSVRPLDATVPEIPAGLPSDLLRRRPDVAEAEQNLVAACAEIGVAKAEFFPKVSLTGSAGFQSSESGNLLDWGSRTWSIGPSVAIPIFKGGQLRANLDKAKARYDETEANYRKSVLSALLDVEDSLTDLHGRADQADAQAKAVASAREYHRLTQIQYKAGMVDYLEVVIAERTLLNNELSEVQTQNERMASTVLLIKALGGGWESQAPAKS